jgi:hypothetical protein
MLFTVNDLGFDGFDAPDAVGRVYGKITNLKRFWEAAWFSNCPFPIYLPCGYQ